MYKGILENRREEDVVVGRREEYEGVLEVEE